MATIFAIGHEAAMTVIAPVGEQLRQSGHDVHVHRSPVVLHTLPRWESVELLIIAATPCSPADMEAAPQLRGIITPTIGFDCVDLPAAPKNAALVANVQRPENQISMAEVTFMLMIAGLYDLQAAERSFWPARPAQRRPDPHNAGHTLELVEARPRLTIRNALDMLDRTIPASCQNPQAPAGASASTVTRWRH
jgi:phosphoglycerate dehydrogenase-like enzyme